MEDITFTTSEIEEKLDIKRERFREWLNRKFIYPTIHVTAGPGDSNIFSYWDVCGIVFFKKYIEYKGFDRVRAMAYYKLWTELLENMTKKNTREEIMKIKNKLCFFVVCSRMYYDKTIHNYRVKPQAYIYEKTNDIQSDEFLQLLNTWEEVDIINIPELLKEVDKKVWGK